MRIYAIAGDRGSRLRGSNLCPRRKLQRRRIAAVEPDGARGPADASIFARGDAEALAKRLRRRSIGPNRSVLNGSSRDGLV
jgi:hypothetical protein